MNFLYRDILIVFNISIMINSKWYLNKSEKVYFKLSFIMIITFNKGK